jgi:hypothetical protein
MADQIFVKVPFALNGDKSPAVPEPLQISGEVSFDQGWPIKYSQDPNLTGLLIERSDMNYLFYLMSLNQKQYQVSGVPLFITTADNGGVPYPYAKNALVLYDAGSGFNIYQSLTNANTALPTVTANWSLIDPYNRLIERNDTVLTGTPTVPTKPPLTAAASTAYADAAVAAAKAANPFCQAKVSFGVDNLDNVVINGTPFNVSSVVRNSEGLFTINFTNPIVGEYCVSALGTANNGGANGAIKSATNATNPPTTKTATQLQIVFGDGTNRVDIGQANILIF